MLSTMPPLLSLALLCSVLFLAASQDVEIGELSDIDHDVSGTVFAVDSRTLRIENFNYDGEGPAAVFWADVGGSATSSGQRVPFKDSCTAPSRLPRNTNTDVLLELPPSLTLADIGYFSVWCEAVGTEFGGIAIPSSIASQVPPLPTASCADDSASSPMTGPFPVQEGWNCEPLNREFQVRWQIVGDTANFQLVARLGDEDRYMGFGPSGATDRTEMIGSDVAIAFRQGEEYSAIDFHMSTRAQCADAEGVCPDSTREPTSNDITDVSGDFMQNITMVQYTRPLAAADATLDRSIETTGPSFVSWAMGPLNPSLRLPLFHDGPIAFPREDVSIEFGREVSNACIDGFQEEEPKPDVPGFEREPLVNVTEITARIGPSGGARGYGTLTGGPAWGIAWYLSPTGSTGEDTLIPVLAVERGKTYKFTVYGGVDDETDRTFHPFYITDSPAGGYGAKTPAQRAAEKVYAGIDRIRNDEDGGVVSFRAPATGALCEIEGSNSGTEKIVSFPRYYSTLNTSCVDDAEITSAGGTLEWTVAADTPDMVYYQCVTHQYLGFKVLVFDEGEVDEKKLREASGGGPLIGSDGEPVPTCDLKFKGKTVSYDGCRKDLEEDVEVYWTIREDDGEIDTLFRAPNTTGYVGLGWGYSQMVEDDGGSNAVIMYRGAGGRAEIMDYALSARSTAGVQPSNNQNITNEDAEFADGYISGMFTRKLEMDGIPTITKGETNVIYALGSRPESATSLTRHSSRFLAMVDLNETTSNFVLPGATPAPLAQPDEAAQCFATFKGENKTYGGCQMGLEGEVDVFWTIREDDGEIDTLFRGRTNGGYVGWAWGYERMVQDGGSNSVIAYRGPSGNAEISDYQMSARTPSGVQPNDNQGLSSMDAEIDGDMVVGVFTRKMVVAGLPPLAVGKVKALWAVGSRPDSATTLVQHTSRTAGEIDLSIAGTGGTVTTVNSTATIFKVHGAFMGLSWFLFAPIAVIFMAYFKKFNPVTFQVHRALNGTVVLLTIAGYIMAVSRGSHTETAHLVIGTIVLALALLQALGGLLRPGIGSKKRSVWYLLHACSGGVLAILAASNAFLGIDIIGGGTGWFVACGVVWGLLVVVYVVLGLFPRKFPRKTPVPVPADGDRDDVEAKGAHETVAEPDTELSI